MKRAILVVLDSVGVGELQDAKSYGDEGSHTLDHVYKACNGLEIKELEKLGLGNIEGVNEPKKCSKPVGAYGRCKEASKGKDTVTGHWEIAGVILEKPLNTYPEGFSEEIIEEFKKRANVKGILGNVVASGTQIIEELGEEHVKTGYPIIYTSADSVFQIAAHEDVISVEKLYEMCQVARDMLVDKWAVGRGIARPFIGKPGNFTRTPKRHDYALDPPINVLDLLDRNGVQTIAIGKISDIFNGKSIAVKIRTKDNMDGMMKIIDFAKGEFSGLLFANLNDFDMLYGHRRDREGYLKALEDFNYYLPIILKNLKKDDLLIITADHGNDPTFKGTDHTRENVPILMYSPIFKAGKRLPDRKTFADIGATILDNFNIKNDIGIGTSIFDELRKGKE